MAMSWASKASLAVMMSTACIDRFPDEPDEDADDDSGPTGTSTGGFETGAQTMSGPFPGSGESTGPIDPSHTSGATEPTDPTDTGPTTGPTTTDACPGGCDSGTSDPGDSVCGVELVHDDDWNTEYVCGCDACNVEFRNVIPAVGEALLEQCECICASVGCGGSVSGGATSEVSGGTGDEDGDGPTTTAGESSNDDDGTYGPEGTGDDGPTDSGGEDTEPTG
jgi:hypothetical protein